GIHSAKDLRDADDIRLRKKFSVVLQRTIFELRGIPCIPFEAPPAQKDQLIFSRSFSDPVTTAHEMQQVLSIYAQKVSTRLRKQGSVAQAVTAWASTSHFNQDQRHHPSITVSLEYPSDEPITIAKASMELLPILISGTRYARAGVVMHELTPKESHAYLPLFQPLYENRNLGETLDRIQEKTGAGSIGIGLGGFKNPPAWNMKRGMLSKRCTTVWSELATVSAGS
ncbi:MAG: DUF4113 domain-containing protein, partial [Microbacteriaceae bacterium]